MITRITAWLRVGLGFFVFGLGVRILAFTALPAIVVGTRDADRRVRRVRALISAGAAWYVKILRFLNLIDVKFEGFEALKGRSRCLIVANHPTLLDAIFIIAELPHVCCIVKPQLKFFLSYRLFMRAARYIVADRTHHLIGTCVAGVQAGESLLIFPEGTRSAELGAFMPGAATIALRAECPLYPVVIDPSAPLLLKHQRWFQQPTGITSIRVSAGEEICGDVRSTLPQDEREARQVLNAAMRNFFEQTMNEERYSR